MAIINFAVTKPLEKKINKTIQDCGFTSKAEFFRFLAINYVEKREQEIMTEEEKFDFLTSQLAQEAKSKLVVKKLPALKEQLSNV